MNIDLASKNSKIILDIKNYDESKLLDYENQFSKDFVFKSNGFLINQKKINSFLRYYKETPFNLKSFKVDLSKGVQSKKNKIISSKTERPYAAERFSISELAKPFFLENILSEKLVLKKYQEEGVNWLLEKNARILADDMGLGKTVQTIAAACNLISKGEIGQVLIVCPSTLVQNWLDELEKWAPSFCAISIGNTGKNKGELWKSFIGYSHFVVTNYEQLREPPDALKNINIDLIIADEAHKIRKKNSKVSKGITSLKYEKFWALTGTPIENNSTDVFNILNIIETKKHLGSVKEYSNISLRALLRTYILRRMKKDVLDEIKDFKEFKYFVPLNEKQQVKYDKLLAEFLVCEEARQLSLFSKLKSICDLDSESKESSKIDFIIELLEKINSRDEKCVIFSFSIEPLEELQARIAELYKKNSAVLFIGSIDREERSNIIETFKTNKDCFVFLCSGKIGGEGLNLTEANHAIFLNEWWNPSNNNQARDRIIRIGQTKEAMIYHIYTANTVESRIIEIIKSKNEITSDIIQKLAKKEASRND